MIEQERHDGITTLRLAHGKASALDVELLEALLTTLDDVERSDARAVVLTGSGSIFSAGVDLFRLTNEGAPYVEQFFPLLSRALRRLFVFPRPIVAAINGHAIAGGCVFAAASDYRVMSAGKARIGVPELTVGVPFPALVLEILRFAYPPQHLQHVVYSGLTFTPDEAIARGLIDEVTEPDALLPRAEAVARQYASLPPDAFRLTKTQLRRSAVERAESLAWLDAEALAIWSAPATHEHVREYLARTVGRK